MAINKMLQVRHRYLQARRNREYELLKEAETLKGALKDLDPIQKLAAISDELRNRADTNNALTCEKCGKEFKFKNGLSSHLRHKTCEEK